MNESTLSYDKSKEVHVFNSSTCAPEPSIPVLGLSDSMRHCWTWKCSSYWKYVMVKYIELNCATSQITSLVSWPVRRMAAFHFLWTNMDTWLLPTIWSNKLYEYTLTGELRREIALQDGVVNPWRAVHMDGDQFLVCQAGGGNNKHRICLIDNRGNLIKSFGSTSGIWKC